MALHLIFQQILSMKKYLLLLLVASIATSTWAQILTLDPGTVVVMDIQATDTDAPAHSTLKNTGDSERTVVWEKNIIEKTEEWDIAICDINNCYFPSVNSKSIILASNAESNIDVHAYPNQVEGYAIVEVKMYDSADTTVQVTGHYYFNYDPNSSEEVTSGKKITLFPNPTRSTFALKEQTKATSEVIVINLLGQEMKRFDATIERSFDISTLPKGNYLVQVVDKEGRTQVTKLLQKM